MESKKISDSQEKVVSPVMSCSLNTTSDSLNISNEPVFHASRSMQDLVAIVMDEKFDPMQLSNEEIVDLMFARHVPVHKLESILGKENARRCVEIRRKYYIRELELADMEYKKLQAQDDTPKLGDNKIIEALEEPHTSSQFDYTRVVGACCENVIGLVRIPVGLAGPLVLDKRQYYVPLATTEGCLVASTSRGLSALAKSGGVMSRLRKNFMTRAPIVRFVDADLRDALKNVELAVNWLEDIETKEKLRASFRSTSKHIELIDYSVHPIGREIHIRFEARTGDAMGMNMCSKGAEMALKEMQRVFPTMNVLTLSGNMCTDKKPSAMNWIRGRGKAVECSATLTPEVVEKMFKVSVDLLCDVWLKKVMTGSALAGSIGGFNCHAANIVAAIFIATGQDAAQVVSSSNCMLHMEKDSRGSLEVHCYMPSIECGTVGGGTILRDQSNYLRLLGIKGPSENKICDSLDSESNACILARVICATVMAAELSLLASLTEGTLVKSHMTHNRSCNVV